MAQAYILGSELRLLKIVLIVGTSLTRKATYRGMKGSASGTVLPIIYFAPISIGKIMSL